MNFEWDKRKSAANIKEHGVAFEEALSVFADPFARIFDDPDHSADERREIVIGHSNQRQLLLVFFTERRDKVRIISARKPTRTERGDYEENS
ncbi:MAG: BrnT family toxin [Terriglobales bacterium]